MNVATITDDLLALLDAKRVFHAVREGRRWRRGERLLLLPTCQLEPYVTITAGHALPRAMGAFSYTHSELRPYVAVGRYGSIGSRVSWLAGRHPDAWATTSPVAYDAQPPRGVAAYFADVGVASQVRDFDAESGLVRIGHDVWIGDEAMIARGVTIGDGAVIGARALVLKDVPPYAVVMGQPAEVRRLRFPEALVERFRAAHWWRYRPEFIQSLPVDDPERFLDALDAAMSSHAPPEIMQPRILTGAEVLSAAEAPAR
ncbi:CatB-related O-acetyltransferase [Phenylobacterium sp.]|uniref:CatB-related O-acetyltransferase n=1 Tax=Phenylobacterium sp. TaxID=1871053 RepID=UPI0025FC99E3|nr:CatB-related O-acetyltransferase [Phenylobacterium sp.]